jgi:hypothetical protein
MYGFYKSWEFIEQLSDCQLLNQNSEPRGYLGNECMVSIRGGEFIYQLNDCQLLSQNSEPRG